MQLCSLFSEPGRGKAAPAAWSGGKDKEDSGTGARVWWLEAPEDELEAQIQQGTCILPLGEGALNRTGTNSTWGLPFASVRHREEKCS